jgi:hypothetical protein
VRSAITSWRSIAHFIASSIASITSITSSTRWLHLTMVIIPETSQPAKSAAG